MAMNSLVLVLALASPAALAGACGARHTRRLASALAPWAALPALAVSVLPGALPTLELPWLLLGTRLGLDATGRVMLLFTALLWTLAGVYARSYLHADPRRGQFTTLFLATMAGNFGVILSCDVVSFYLCFALMTFAAYGLVVHDGSPAARRAGRVYITLALAGEAALLVAFLLASAAAGSLEVRALAVAAATAPNADVIRLLLVAGFGVKAGLLPLHVWLPLAHPIAPTPASAVLSGALIKAGLLGWLRFLPLGIAPFADLGIGCVAAGAFATFFGVAVGLTQVHPKALLAYSSISQMGFITIGVGIALAEPALWPATWSAVTLYAVHHGLAKGALFLGAGLAAAGANRSLVIAGSLLPALALAGAPLTSGVVAKLALKQVANAAPLTAGWLTWVFAAAALGTTLLMARFLRLLATSDTEHLASAHATAETHSLLLPWLASLAAVAGVTWVVAWGQARLVVEDSFAAQALVAAAWPVAAGVLIAYALESRRRNAACSGYAIPAGDVLVAATVSFDRLRRAAAPATSALCAAMKRTSACCVVRWTSWRSSRALRIGDAVRTSAAAELLFMGLLALLLMSSLW